MVLNLCPVKLVFYLKYRGLTKKHLSQFIKKEALAQVFCCGFCEIFKNIFFYRTPLVAASELCELSVQSCALRRNRFEFRGVDCIL